MKFADLPGHPARKAARRQKEEVEIYLVEKFAAQDLNDAKTVGARSYVIDRRVSDPCPDS